MRTTTAKAALLAALTAGSLLATACASTEGKVTDRDYYAPHKDCGKYGCNHEPEQWQLHLDNGRDPCVPKDVYDAHPPGSYFVDDGTAYYWGCMP